MSNNTAHRVSLSNGNPSNRLAFSLGLKDKQAGKGFRPEHERATRSWQLAYENGRLTAANLLAAGLPIPDYRGGKDTFKISHLSSQSAALVGAAIPVKRAA